VRDAAPFQIGDAAAPVRVGSRIVARAALIGLTSIAIVGCGANRSTPAEARLQREDLIAVSRALRTAEGSSGREVATTKAAWPLIVNGLPSSGAKDTRAPIAAAVGNAAKLVMPTLFEEAHARALTGPGAQLAGLFRTYAGLSTRGWKLIAAAIEETEHGSPTAARFARENVGLYIESVYDGHFDLAQIDKQLSAGYRKLGGPAVFGRALTQSEVDALASVYSEAADRLHPHVGARFGS
jgi:hypothetical protein